LKMDSSTRRIRNLANHLTPPPPTSSLSSQQTASSNKEYNNILVEKRGQVAIITLNRPKALNALCAALVFELVEAVHLLDADDSVGAIELTGGPKVFAAGADIKEMDGLNSFANVRFTPKSHFDIFATISDIKKPLIAAVNGFALGGGCEVAMLCDIAIAGDTAKFGQPEIKIGAIPGLGGTQRLTRIVGKSKAMELVLTGNTINANEAKELVLVSRVVPASTTIDEAVKLASQIASLSRPVVSIAKESVNVAYESTLAEGLRFEKRAFQSTFGLRDRKEGMEAFVAKRAPKWEHK